MSDQTGAALVVAARAALSLLTLPLQVRPPDRPGRRATAATGGLSAAGEVGTFPSKPFVKFVAMPTTSGRAMGSERDGAARSGPGRRPRPSLELAGIVRAHGEAYRRSYALTPDQAVVLRDIGRCRTTALGGHPDVCDRCAPVRVL